MKLRRVRIRAKLAALAVYSRPKSARVLFFFPFSILFRSYGCAHFVVNYLADAPSGILGPFSRNFATEPEARSRASWFWTRRRDSLCVSASNRPVGHRCAKCDKDGPRETENTGERSVWLSRGRPAIDTMTST